MAAGFANYDDRNRDYQTIECGLRFQRDRSIEDHDTVIWVGDFNYRIGLSNQNVRELLLHDEYQRLYSNDQVLNNPIPRELYHSANNSVVEFANGGGKGFSFLLRGTDQFPTDVQI